MVLPKRAFLTHNEIIPLKQNVQASFPILTHTKAMTFLH